MIKQYLYIFLLLAIITVSFYITYNAILSSRITEEGMTEPDLAYTTWDLDAIKQINREKGFTISDGNLKTWLKYVVLSLSGQVETYFPEGGGGYTSLGCYADNASRMVPNYRGEVKTNQACYDIAKSTKPLPNVFALQYAGQCYTGDSVPSAVQLGKASNGCNRSTEVKRSPWGNFGLSFGFNFGPPAWGPGNPGGDVWSQMVYKMNVLTKINNYGKILDDLYARGESDGDQILKNNNVDIQLSKIESFQEGLGGGGSRYKSKPAAPKPAPKPVAVASGFGVAFPKWSFAPKPAALAVTTTAFVQRPPPVPLPDFDCKQFPHICKLIEKHVPRIKVIPIHAGNKLVNTVSEYDIPSYLQTANAFLSDGKNPVTLTQIVDLPDDKKIKNLVKGPFSPVDLIPALQSMGIRKYTDIPEDLHELLKQLGATVPDTPKNIQNLVFTPLSAIGVNFLNLHDFVREWTDAFKSMEKKQFFPTVLPILVKIQYIHSKPSSAKQLAYYVHDIHPLTTVSPDITSLGVNLTDTSPDPYIQAAMDLEYSHTGKLKVVEQFTLFSDMVKILGGGLYSSYIDTLDTLKTSIGTASLQLIFHKFKIWSAYVSGKPVTTLQSFINELQGKTSFGLDNDHHFVVFLNALLNLKYSQDQLFADIDGGLTYADFFNAKPKSFRTQKSGFTTLYDYFFGSTKERFTVKGTNTVQQVYGRFGINGKSVNEAEARFTTYGFSNWEAMMDMISAMIPYGINVNNYIDVLELLKTQMKIQPNKQAEFLNKISKVGVKSIDELKNFIQSLESIGVDEFNYDPFMEKLSRYASKKGKPDLVQTNLFIQDMVSYGFSYSGDKRNQMDQLFNTIIARKMVLSKYSTELKPILLAMKEADDSKPRYATGWADFTYSGFSEPLDDFFQILAPFGTRNHSTAKYMAAFPTTFSAGSNYMNMGFLINFVYPSEYRAIRNNNWRMHHNTQLKWINDLIQGMRKYINQYLQKEPKETENYNGHIRTLNMMILFPFASFQHISDNIQKTDYSTNMNPQFHYNVASTYRKNVFA